jgi:hypothetical protein
MKKYISNLLFIGLLGFSTLSAKDTYKVLDPHRIYFGPEFLQLNVDTRIEDIHIKGTKSLTGFCLGYEYLDPWAFYAGVDISSAIDSHGFRASEENQRLYSSDQPVGLANFDLRLGYTIGSAKSSYALFLGTGSYYLGTAVHNRGFHEGWGYLSSGLRALFNVNHVFSIGTNLKAMKGIGYAEFANHNLSVKDNRYPWGCEIGVPFVWSFNPARTWTFQLEPYWSQLNFSQNQQVLGSKFLISAQF